MKWVWRPPPIPPHTPPSASFLSLDVVCSPSQPHSPVPPPNLHHPSIHHILCLYPSQFCLQTALAKIRENHVPPRKQKEKVSDPAGRPDPCPLVIGADDGMKLLFSHLQHQFLKPLSPSVSSPSFPIHLLINPFPLFQSCCFSFPCSSLPWIFSLIYYRGLQRLAS